jgi:multiple sugar transport system permease protein
MPALALHGTRAGIWRYGRAYALLFPALAVLGLLVFYPLALSVWDSLHVDNLLLQDHHFVGLRNYTDVVTVLVGGAMAFYLHGMKRFRGLALAVLLLPWAIPGVVNGALWSLIFNPQTGLLDGLLVAAHVTSKPILWMGGTTSAVIAISVTLVWQLAPITAIFLLAGLESIPGGIYEAAAVDGAVGTRVFLRITIPLLRPALAVALLWASVAGISAFDQIAVLNGYAPNTLSVVMQLYLYAFRDFNFGYGIAASMLVTGAALGVSLVYLKAIYREVAY